MADRHVVIVGGGLAGLSAGCYALRSGYRATIVEHNLALGGVCTAWQRGSYTVDGCIHWLTGGPFLPLYEELGIVPKVPLRTLETWMTYRDVREGWEIALTRDLDGVAARLAAIAPRDLAEIERLRRAASAIVTMHPPLDAPELASVPEKLRSFWAIRGTIGRVGHYRKPMGEWVREHLVSPGLQRMFTRMTPEAAPAFLFPMVLGWLEAGYLSRPMGGTAAFRDALELTYRGLGGEAVLHATVDEVLVSRGRASGVRLADGTMIEGDAVISTASLPETMLRLLGGRHEAAGLRELLARRKLFDPIVLASFGVAKAYPEVSGLLTIDGIAPFAVGGRANDALHLRIGNDDPSFAPPGHAVLQAVLRTDYDWWATRGTRYRAEKDAVAETALAALEPHFSDLRAAVRMTDLATPLTYWTTARSWRGAYEGWIPTADVFFRHVAKTIPGLERFYMAGQWVDGGGVPPALMSGRQAVQLLCADEGRSFVAKGGARPVAREEHGTGARP